MWVKSEEVHPLCSTNFWIVPVDLEEGGNTFLSLCFYCPKCDKAYEAHRDDTGKLNLSTLEIVNNAQHQGRGI